jgi:23S rRNA pseudoU1915 N3-methylase RlmH
MRILFAPNPAPSGPAAGGTGAPTSTPSSNAAPVAPAAAPTAPAAAPASTPAKQASPFDELDTLTTPEPKAPAAAPAAGEPPKASEPPKPAAAADPKAGDRQFQGPKELREYAKRLEGENQSLKTRITEVEKKIGENQDAGKNTQALTERLATLEKELKEREAKLYELDAEQSPEFKKNFVAPFNKAAEFAKQQIESLEVVETGADGETQSTRPATFEDFKALYGMPLNKAVKAANAMFGESAQLVINHITELHRLEYQRVQALQETRETAAQRRKQDEDTRIANQSKEREAVNTMWREVNSDIYNRNTEFHPDPQDAKEKTIVDKATLLVDSSYGERKEQTLQQKVLLDAEIRHRAIREPLLRYRLKKSQAEVSELKAVIEELKGGKPGNTNNPGGQPTAQQPKGLLEELETLE